jgi:hypothetical protein
VNLFLLGVLTLLSSWLPRARPEIAKPWIQRIRIAGDTVWFEGERGYDSVKVRYCFARRTGAWCRLPRPGLADRADAQLPRGGADSVTLAAGVTLVCRPPVAHSADCETFGVRVRGDANVHALVPRATAKTLAMLQKAAKLETDEPPTMSEFITAWAASDDAIWFGLGGGFPEGYGAYGGLLRFDRTRRTVETIVNAALADATVTGLAVDGDTLWVGTIHPAEYGPVGSTGVLCRNLRTKQWTTLDPAGAWLPDRIIQTLAAHDGAVYIATRDGLAAFDTRASRWTVRYFRQTVIAGSIGYELVDRRPRESSPAQ